jgi:hypothetical protein
MQQAHSTSEKLINAYPSSENLSENLIDTVDNEIFLINESLPTPLLTIADKLLGRQNLSFEHLTSPEQEL